MIRAILMLLLFTSFLGASENKDYRVYDESSPSHVKNFYLQNHQYQTLDFVLQKKERYASLEKQRLTIFEALALFDQIIDESDPDMDLPQSYHLFQTAEAIRKDGHPDWFVLVGLIHDLGKILTLYGEPQWAVVGDTYPVGCAYSDKIVFFDYFKNNPDAKVSLYQTQYGIYSPECGLENVHMSFGHDEYLYYVIKDYLPFEASYIIRYHSFYAAHEQGEYQHLMNSKDKEMLSWLKNFQRYDLYSKSAEKLDIDALMPYYTNLLNKYFPHALNW